MRPWTVLAFAAALLAASPAFADDAAPADPVPVCTKDGAPVSADYLQLAQDILVTTKSAERMNTMLDATLPTMLELIRKAVPDMTDETMAAFKVALHDEMQRSIPGLISVEACVYTQHFSMDELQQLTRFYKEPLGQKMLTEMPAIMSESMALGRAWGERAGRTAMQRVIAKFRKEGDHT